MYLEINQGHFLDFEIHQLEFYYKITWLNYIFFFSLVINIVISFKLVAGLLSSYAWLVTRSILFFRLTLIFQGACLTQSLWL